MITQPTVLILGAGASAPYGFPTGAILKQQVLENIRPKLSAEKNVWKKYSSYETTIIEQCGFSPEVIWKFYEAFRRSQRLSVDAFLEHRPEFIPIGKLAIAQCLIPHEDEDNLFNNSKGFYQHLFEQMRVPFEEFHKNQLSIITFNYDRSFEHALFNYLKNGYVNKSDKDCVEVIDQIPIIHVHGYLGPLPWQSENNTIPYTAEATTDILQTAKEQIIIVHEADKTSPEFEQAHQLILDARKLIFLGFGYYPVNLQRLKLDSLPKNRWIDNGQTIFRQTIGSSLGMGSAEMEVVRLKWKIHFPSKTYDCLQLLKEDVVLD